MKIASRKGRRKCNGSQLPLAMVLPVGSLFFSSADCMGIRTFRLQLQTGRWMSTIEWVSLHAIGCYNKYTDSVKVSINIGVTSVRKYFNSMRRRWNSTAIKRMHERLKPGPFSSSSLGLGTRLSYSILIFRTSPIHAFHTAPYTWKRRIDISTAAINDTWKHSNS